MMKNLYRIRGINQKISYTFLNRSDESGSEMLGLDGSSCAAEHCSSNISKSANRLNCRTGNTSSIRVKCCQCFATLQMLANISLLCRCPQMQPHTHAYVTLKSAKLRSNKANIISPHGKTMRLFKQEYLQSVAFHLWLSNTRGHAIQNTSDVNLCSTLSV